MALTPMHARKAHRDRDRAEAEARLLQEAPKARQVRLQDAPGLTTVATDALADKPNAPQTRVADLQHQVDGLKLQLTEITVLLTKIITSKTDDFDDAPAPVIAPAPLLPLRSAQDRSARSRSRSRSSYFRFRSRFNHRSAPAQQAMAVDYLYK